MSDSPHSKVLRRWVDEAGGRSGYSYWCQGCEGYHSVCTSSGGWRFNGDINKPTFAPSVLIRGGHYASHYKQGDNCWCTYNAEQIAKGEEPSKFQCDVCHTFITDGMVQFLGDCTHKYAGQTLPLPEYPRHEE